jgi:hypothetical protein
MHAFGIEAFDETGRPAIPAQQVSSSLWSMRASSVGLLILYIEVKNGKDGAVADGVQELIDVPRSCQRPGLRFSVAHHGRDDQAGIVGGGAAGVGPHIAELASLMDRPRRWLPMPPGKENCLKNSFKPAASSLLSG